MQGSLSTIAIFFLISSITPGPNNLMLLHGSIRKGFLACFAHILGISVGVLIMIACSYWGLAKLITEWPVAMIIIKTCGTLYLLWLAWGMGQHGIVPSDSEAKQAVKKTTWQLPLNFWQAMLFQWINPKAWITVAMLPSMAIFIGGNPIIANVPIYLLSLVISLFSLTVWAAGGNGLRHFLHRQKTMKLINIGIIAMTIYCAVALWF